MRLSRSISADTFLPARRSRTWLWAAGSIAAVILVLGATLMGHAVVAGRHAPPLMVAAPPVPPLAVLAATPPDVSAQLVALDANAGHLVALTTIGEPTCPPDAACPPAPPLQRFIVFDGQTGAVLATIPLAGSVTQSVLLFADSSRHLAYAVAPESVDIYSTVTGQRTGGYALPSIHWERESGGVLDATWGELLLAGGGYLEALDAATGHPLAVWQAPAGMTATDGPLLDEVHGLVYLLARPATGQPELVALDAATLAPVGQVTLPGGSRLGPLDAATQTLYVSGKSGAPCQYQVNTTSGLALAPAENTATACDASAVGWNSVLQHIYAAGPAGISVRDASTAHAVAALPVRVAWPATAPLPVDATRGLVYLPDERGTILIARDGATPGALSGGSAALLARAAMARFLPNTNQDPPFVAPESFPAAEGTTHLDFWQHYSDIGWHGPYAGTTTTAVSTAPGQPGSYLVTFSMSWYQVFQRQHTWVCLVAPDGSVLLQAESGDGVP